MALRDCSDGAVVLELEQDEGCGGDLRDATGVETDPAQGLEGGLEQGVGALADAVDAADDLVVGLLDLGQLTFSGLLMRVPEAVAGVLVSGVDRGGHVRLGGDAVGGVDQAVVAGAGGVVLSARGDGRDPDRPAVRGGDALYVPAVVLVFS